jgi:hypothetical protein
VSVVVKLPGANREKTYEVDDLEVDDTGTLLLTTGEGRSERTVAAFAAGAWIFAERR